MEVPAIRLVFALLTLALLPAPAVAAKPASTGITCTGEDGAVRRFNIDLKRGRYEDGESQKWLASITDTKIVLRGPNADLVSGAGALGPVLSSLELDRTTLVLTDQTMMPERNVNRTVLFRCERGPAIDFTAGRRF